MAKGKVKKNIAKGKGNGSNKIIKASMMKKIFLNKLGKLSLAEKVQKASGDAANQEEAA